MPVQSVTKKRAICQFEGCTEKCHSGRAYCYEHHRDRENKRRRERRRSDVDFRVRHSGYARKRRGKIYAARRDRKKSDPAYLVHIAYRKRAVTFRKHIQQWCTEAYLRNARREDRIYAVALRKWIKEWKAERQRLEGFDPLETKRANARDGARQRYWADPEAGRQKSQAFKHSRPDYRERWNAKRGALEKELSDGTITREAVAKLFVQSVRCPYCGDPYSKSRRSLDHITPLAKANGRKLHSITNVLVCCLICNHQKRTRSLNEFLGEIRKSKTRKRIVQTTTLPLLEHI